MQGSFSETGCPFYPGELLSGQLKAFKEIEWLQGELPKDNRAKVFVEQVVFVEVVLFCNEIEFHIDATLLFLVEAT